MIQKRTELVVVGIESDKTEKIGRHAYNVRINDSVHESVLKDVSLS